MSIEEEKTCIYVVVAYIWKSRARDENWRNEVILGLENTKKCQSKLKI